MPEMLQNGNFSLSVTVCVNQWVCDGVTGCQNSDDVSYTNPFCVRYEVIRKHSAEKKAELYFYQKFVTHQWRIQNFPKVGHQPFRGANIRFCQNYMKLKEFGRGGGTCPKFHYVDLPLHTVLTNEKTILNGQQIHLDTIVTFTFNLTLTLKGTYKILRRKYSSFVFVFLDLIHISVTFKCQFCLNIIVHYVQRIGPI